MNDTEKILGAIAGIADSLESLEKQSSRVEDRCTTNERAIERIERKINAVFMQNKIDSESVQHIFGVDDWNRWLDHLANRLLGMTGSEFEAAFDSGSLARSGPAQDLGSMLPLIRKLRQS
jgi:hypothetical protein